MIYVLDFDRTIFDTEAFIAELEVHGLMERFPDPSIVADLGKHVALQEFVFPDALEFLKRHGAETIVLSSGLGRSGPHGDITEFLKAKIQAAGVTDLVHEVITVPDEKRSMLQELKEKYGDELVFVDDMPEHVEAARELGITAFLRAQNCGGGSPESFERSDRFCITSLDELDARVAVLQT